MKTLLTAFAFVITTVAFTACQQSTSTSDATSGKSTFTNSGPDVDLLKKIAQAYEKGDWETYRALHSDSAVCITNEWAPATTAKYTPIDTVVAFLKKYRSTIESISLNQPIYEVVTDSAGNKYGHQWSNMTLKYRNQPKAVNQTAFTSFGIKNGKVTYVWTIVGDAK